jgi:hypothetical protein
VTTTEKVEALLANGASDEEVLESLDTFEDREEAAELLRLYRRREGWTPDQKRDHAALMLLIATRRAFAIGDLHSVVAAQKALGTLEGLEVDPSFNRDARPEDAPIDEVNARIRKIVEEHPELMAELGFVREQ